jgi:hypothetical protein
MNYFKKAAAYVTAFFATLFIASISDDVGGVVNPLSAGDEAKNKN